MSAATFPPGAFAREDETGDAAFYVEPRFKTHIDDQAIAALTAFYGEVLPAGGIVLDLMSSWVSHYPQDLEFAECIGHGMNAEELAANPRFSRWFLQDLNQDLRLPLDNGSLDAATITVSVQYLQHPIEVLSDLKRCLKPGAPVTIAFSNRCFPTKAVAIWRQLYPHQHASLVELYLREAGFTTIEVNPLKDGRTSDPMTVVVGRKPALSTV